MLFSKKLINPKEATSTITSNDVLYSLDKDLSMVLTANRKDEFNNKEFECLTVYHSVKQTKARTVKLFQVTRFLDYDLKYKYKYEFKIVGKIPDTDISELKMGW